MRLSYSQIIADLLKSKKRGNIVALKVKGTEKPMLTAVNDVKANRIVTINQVSVYGSQIDNYLFHIEDIESLKVYSALYMDPVYVRIRQLKSSIDEIKRSFRW
jgi:hypothetical protein